ncbi:hypothetical protein Q0M94_19920 (plasmid) [Deinococcus radiomollis]|uniref:hypothetical protein n=1 Tax=Deinococcus radiomollis TaxID=468916 RepID=UPI0038928CFF
MTQITMSRHRALTILLALGGTLGHASAQGTGGRPCESTTLAACLSLLGLSASLGWWRPTNAG